ncbi:16S rRNA (guanine(966)-N(2))-methyltransferase RsmD [Balneolaceae bacterium ANBcel3]|nr:16S rRNA (guanine(966)-N(2))-methyltransferase RsmD [Balneolaceae bacterium ANBcel3]
MRIITGTLKGRRITVPKNTEIRPTSDRTKESIFNIIDARSNLNRATVLDLFAGSGNLGFEAISRGAAHVLSVEASFKAVEHIEKTAELFGVKQQIQALCSTVERFLSGPSTPYDFIFADPPYDYEHLPDLPDLILGESWLKPGGWFLLEHDKRYSFAEHPNCVFSKPYGRTIVTIFMAASPED